MELKSTKAVGFTMFAAIMLMINGSFQLIAGLAGIFENDFYVRTPNYLLEFDASVWGWVHLIWGVLVLIGGLGLLTASLWGRTLGVIAAAGSALTAFAFIPLYPVWSVVVISVDVTVIWALTAHGRDIVAD
ncbi:MAG TPA: hypothetical protein VFI35_09540 [Actinomycetota bacterium]|nr:hypothetical protein [Actinomycetota bacterium]